MINMLEHQALDLHHARTAELIGAADRHRRTQRGAGHPAPAGGRLPRWMARLWRLSGLGTAPAGRKRHGRPGPRPAATPDRGPAPAGWSTRTQARGRPATRQTR